MTAIVSGATAAARGKPRAALGPYPLTAAVLIVAAGLPIRFRVGFAVFGSFTLLDVVLAGAALRVLVGILGRQGRVIIGDRWVGLLLAVPFLATLLSLAWTHDLTATLRTAGMFTEAMIAYWVVLNVFTGVAAPWLFRALAALVALLLLGSLLSLLQVPGFGPHIPPDYVVGSREYIERLTTYYGRLSNPFYGLSNDFASVLALFVLPLLAWGVVRRSVRYTVIAGALFAAMVLTLSRGVILATLLGGVLFLAAERRRLGRWLPAVAVGLVMLGALGILYYQLNESVQRHILDRLSAETIQVRQEILSRALQQIIDAPLLGYGAGVITDPVLVDGVHNTYLQQALYFGVPIGLACSAALWLLAIRFLSWPSRTPGARVLAIGCGLSVLIQLGIFVVETSFEATLPKTAFYFFAAYSTVILVALNREPPA